VRGVEEGGASVVDRGVLRWGGAAAMLGAVLGIVFNILHPRGNDTTPAGELQLIADSDIWLFDHYMLGWVIALSFIGLVAFGWSFAGTTAATWARIATASAIVGGAIGSLAIAIDGAAMKAIADQWATGSESVRAAAEIAVRLQGAFFIAVIGSYVGLTPVLYGIAILSSDEYPAWLGYLALAAGIVGLVTASWMYLTEITTANINLYVVASLLATVWLFFVGLQLWRGAPGPSTAEPARDAIAA